MLIYQRVDHLPKFPLDHVPLFTLVVFLFFFDDLMGIWGKTNQGLMVQMALGITHIND